MFVFAQRGKLENFQNWTFKESFAVQWFSKSIRPVRCRPLILRDANTRLLSYMGANTRLLSNWVALTLNVFVESMKMKLLSCICQYWDHNYQFVENRARWDHLGIRIEFWALVVHQNFGTKRRLNTDRYGTYFLGLVKYRFRCMIRTNYQTTRFSTGTSGRTDADIWVQLMACELQTCIGQNIWYCIYSTYNMSDMYLV